MGPKMVFGEAVEALGDPVPGHAQVGFRRRPARVGMATLVFRRGGGPEPKGPVHMDPGAAGREGASAGWLGAAQIVALFSMWRRPYGAAVHIPGERLFPLQAAGSHEE